MSKYKQPKQGWNQPYHQSMALHAYIDKGGCTPEGVTEHWHRAFCCIAKYLGFNRQTRRILWNELVAGNWERLHMTDAEEEYTPDHWLACLGDDVRYCSDRWSLDRLTRCHWLYRMYMGCIEKWGCVSDDDMGEVVMERYKQSAPANSCVFCDNEGGCFFDYTNGPYLFFCDDGRDTRKGVAGECGAFKRKKEG